MIDISPQPSLLLEPMRNQGYTLVASLADIIDNSIDAAAKNVKIYYQPTAIAGENTHPFLAILDDGFGIESQHRLIDALTLAKTTKKSDNLGKYGMGLKQASIAHCRKFFVITKSKNTGFAGIGIFDIDKMIAANKWIIDVIAIDANVESSLVKSYAQIIQNMEHGTCIVWENIDKHLNNTRYNSDLFFKKMMESREQLALVFCRAIMSRKISIEINGQILTGIDPTCRDNPDTISSPLRYSTGFSWRSHLLPNGTMMDDVQGFAVYRNDRLVSHSNWLLRTLKKKNALRNIVVEINIDGEDVHHWVLPYQKNGIVAKTTSTTQELKNIYNKIEKKISKEKIRRDVIFGIRQSTELILQRDLEDSWEIKLKSKKSEDQSEIDDLISDLNKFLRIKYLRGK
jgi:hypothetical protein